ncbi:hypothetical protein U9M48_027485 [Paspalum notatum var. saurae]|uniref:Uncharacterized protein n=1 Tax=Paspalum notatum var. saurae TaxID=547442 RepID=A0AAQ3WZH5_PASNO
MTAQLFQHAAPPPVHTHATAVPIVPVLRLAGLGWGRGAGMLGTHGRLPCGAGAAIVVSCSPAHARSHHRLPRFLAPCSTARARLRPWRMPWQAAAAGQRAAAVGNSS